MLTYFTLTAIALLVIGAVIYREYRKDQKFIKDNL